jgi:S-adenosylmethionine-diacylgycerolhomoserine-N-methlytransferase
MSPRELLADSRVLWQMLRGQPRTGSAAERLQAFYAPQANRYDAFRERLLRGRDELIERLPAPAGGVVVELGGGTGANMERFGGRLNSLKRYVVVDLCTALLDQARLRARSRPNVEIVEADVTRYRPAEGVDCVYFSYALTMIDDWRAAIANALAMLKPGGTLGVVDFYVSGAKPRAGFVHHPAWERWFWRRWFSHDGVRLSPDHLDALVAALPDSQRLERRAAVPYLLGMSVPFYLFTGRKPAAAPG